MVKKISELYLEARRAFLTVEDEHTSSLLARNLLCFLTGKTQEEILANREMYTSEEVCFKMEDAVKRILEGEPIAYTQADATFHYHIYCATHNPYFIKSYNAVSDMIIRNLHRLNAVADAFRFSRSFHLHLYEYIRDRKADEALKEMENHDAYNETRFAAFSAKENIKQEG